MEKIYKVQLSYGYAGCSDEVLEVTTSATGQELEEELFDAIFGESCISWWFEKVED